MPAALISVVGNLSDHGAGAIKAEAACATVFAQGVPVIKGIPSNSTNADPDSLCKDSNNHCIQPGPNVGSATVLVEGVPVHRVGDLRGCGGITIPGINLTVYANPV